MDLEGQKPSRIPKSIAFYAENFALFAILLLLRIRIYRQEHHEPCLPAGRRNDRKEYKKLPAFLMIQLVFLDHLVN